MGRVHAAVGKWGRGSTAIALWVAAAGCNMAQFAANTSAPAIKAASRSLQEESDLKLAREAGPAQLKTADGFLAASPKNRVLLEVVARGYLEFAFGFLEDELEALPDDSKHEAERAELTARITALYDRALTYALRLLATDDKYFDAAFKKNSEAVESELQKLDADSAPALLLAGQALVSSINLNRTDLGRVVELPKAVAMLKRAYELDKTYANAAPAFTLGLIHGAQGKAMGGNPELSRKFFEEAIALTGGRYLLTKVMMARFLGVVTLDRALFDNTLKAVLETPMTIAPEYRLANELARRRAARYLKQADDLF